MDSDREEKNEEPERWVDGYWGGLRKASMAGRQVQCVMSWVRGIDVMRPLEAFGPRAEDWEDRRHGQEWKLDVWIVSGSQIGLGNEDKSRTDLYLKTLARVGPSSEKSGKREEETVNGMDLATWMTSTDHVQQCSSPSTMHWAAPLTTYFLGTFS